MIKLEFSKGFLEFFEQFGLTSFDDFFDYANGEIINKNKKRNVVRFALGENENRRAFFMKRFHDPHFKDMLFTLGNFGRICSQAACEWQNANKLLANNIETYRPACYGQLTKLGLEKKSFFVTEQLNGCCLTNYIAEQWSALDSNRKENMMKSIGRFVRKIHDAQISMPDLYVWHLFVAEVADSYDFSIIDLHRMKINSRSDREKIRNLGAFDYSMLPEYFDDKLREIFMDSYMGTDFKGDRTAFQRKIKARSRVLSSRRRKPKY